jgi:hypothetical protein
MSLEMAANTNRANEMGMTDLMAHRQGSPWGATERSFSRQAS